MNRFNAYERFVVVKAAGPFSVSIKFSAMVTREARTAAYECAAALSKLFPAFDALFEESPAHDCTVTVEVDTPESAKEVRAAMNLFANAFKK